MISLKIKLATSKVFGTETGDHVFPKQLSSELFLNKKALTHRLSDFLQTIEPTQMKS